MNNSQIKFKETEIGLIPNDWEVLKVKDVAKINRQSIGKEFCIKEIEYLDIASVDKGQIVDWQKMSIGEAPSRARRMLQDNDFVISTVRPNLKHYAFIEKADNRSIASTGFATVSGINSDPRYLYYGLTNDEATEYFSMVADQQQSTYPTMNPETIENYKLAMPPLLEQRKIAEVLGVLDEKIELNRKMNKTLESLAQVIFKKWFIDNVDPDWKIKKLGDVVRIKYGKNLPTTKLLESGYPVFGGNGQIGFFDKCLYELPQVLVACRGAASGRVNFSLPKSFVTNNSLILEYDNSLNYEFLKYFALNADFYSCVSGSAQPQITIESLDRYEIVMPDRETLDRFSQVVRPLTQKILLNDNEIKTLSQIRDSLLPRLMSGKLRVN